MQLSDVVIVCAELCIKAESGPLGVAFAWSHEGRGRTRYRIERGSGIAGRGHAWGVVELPSGLAQPKVTTRRALRRQLLETMAEGPRPEPCAGFEVYARWHHRAGIDSVQWFTRRRSPH